MYVYGIRIRRHVDKHTNICVSILTPKDVEIGQIKKS